MSSKLSIFIFWRERELMRICEDWFWGLVLGKMKPFNAIRAYYTIGVLLFAREPAYTCIKLW